MKGQQLKQLVVPALALTTLMSCTVRSDPVVTSAPANPISITAISFVLEDDTPASRLALLSALKTQLVARGIDVDEGAPFVGDLALSNIAADVPLYASEAGQSQSEPEPIVEVREPRWIDACKAARTRATLAIFRVSDGALVNRSIAEAIVCADDEPPFAGLAKTLIDDILKP